MEGRVWWFVTGIDPKDYEDKDAGVFKRSTWLVPMEVDDYGVIFNKYGMPVAGTIKGPLI